MNASEEYLVWPAETGSEKVKMKFIGRQQARSISYVTQLLPTFRSSGNELDADPTSDGLVK